RHGVDAAPYEPGSRKEYSAVEEDEAEDEEDPRALHAEAGPEAGHRPAPVLGPDAWLEPPRPSTQPPSRPAAGAGQPQLLFPRTLSHDGPPRSPPERGVYPDRPRSPRGAPRGDRAPPPSPRRGRGRGRIRAPTRCAAR